jgi:hypothetical protein
MGLDDGGPRRGNEEDALERLLREQTMAERLNKATGGEGGGVGEDDENEPEWADADVNEPMEAAGPTSSGHIDRPATGGNEVKRNLLFEVRKDVVTLSLCLSICLSVCLFVCYRTLVSRCRAISHFPCPSRR